MQLAGEPFPAITIQLEVEHDGIREARTRAMRKALLKDAPASFSAAVVTISEIDLVGSSGTLVLSTTKTTTDLLKLSNDTATLVKDAVVPPGTYTQLRFVITGGCIDVGVVVYASVAQG